MKKIIVLFLTIALTGFSNLRAQHTDGGVIGFSCSFVGKPSFLVKKMSKTASKSSYDEIRRKLVKGTMAEKYLAIVLCEVLVKKNKIVLTAAERRVIEDSYYSQAKVAICSGCAMFQTTSISELLNQTSINYIGGNARTWAERIVNTTNKPKQVTE